MYHIFFIHSSVNEHLGCLKWINDLNVRPETIKLLEENIGRRLSYINQNKIFHDPPPRVIEIKTKISGT